MTSTPPVPHTDEELRAIYNRLALIDRHFDACCAFQQDACGWADEYNDLAARLQMAGVPDAVTSMDPLDPAQFEAWLQQRSTQEDPRHG